MADYEFNSSRDTGSLPFPLPPPRPNLDVMMYEIEDLTSQVVTHPLMRSMSCILDSAVIRDQRSSKTNLWEPRSMEQLNMYTGMHTQDVFDIPQVHSPIR